LSTRQRLPPLNAANQKKPVCWKKKSVLRGIEMLRGLAAVLIVMHHADHLLWQDRYGGIRPFHGLFGEFHVGVDFFFVLSGFIIAWVHWGDIGRRSRLRHYAARRFTRIYPAYWALLIPLAILYHLFPANGLPEA
jgi:exopolysaccharide production protein ExoZ